MTWMETISKRPFDLANPKQEDVHIIDIAHALARLCRFTGHVDAEIYSVAQHSVMVSYLVPGELALAGLLHDAAEAYTGDISRPMKELLGEPIRVIEGEIEAVIAERFGVGWHMRHPAVKEADNRMLATERRDLKGGDREDGPAWALAKEPYTHFQIKAWDAPRAAFTFVKRYSDLQMARGKSLGDINKDLQRVSLHE